MALVLSERGFGTLNEILRMRTDLALDAWNYVQFKADWVETEAVLNRKEETR